MTEQTETKEAALIRAIPDPNNPGTMMASREPLSMLEIIGRAATDPMVDVSKMERLLAVAEQIHAREAKAAYDQALNAAQTEMRPISRDCHNPQTRSKYASYEAIDTAIRPIYTAHGFAMSFGSRAASNTDRVIVTCRISHRGGHTENVELEMPCDGQGAKGGQVMTKVHATGSALSYAKRYIANLVWNLSFGEHDDDGNAAGSRTRQNRQTTSTPHPTNQNAPQASVEVKKAASSDVLPKAATELTREWALRGLCEIYTTAEVKAYFAHRGWMHLENWPLEHVPTSKEALNKLAAEIGKWLEPQQASDEGDGLPQDIASVVISVPRKGQKRAAYLQSPDTIGSLYAGMKAGDKAAQSRLWGLALNYVPEGYQGRPPSQEDLDCREGLDRFVEWERKKKGDSGHEVNMSDDETVGMTP